MLFTALDDVIVRYVGINSTLTGTGVNVNVLSLKLCKESEKLFTVQAYHSRYMTFTKLNVAVANID